MRTHRTAALWIVAALILTLVPLVAPVHAADGTPALRLFSTKQEVKAIRYGKGNAARLESVLFLGVTQGALDLRVRRDSFADPLSLTQVVHSGDQQNESQLPAELLDGWRGLDNFLRLKVVDDEGQVVWSKLATFCPNTYWRQRLNDQGPAVPTFPYGCYRSPRLLGMAWGVDEGWAVSANRGLSLPVPDGTYSVDIAITRSYRDLFGIAAEDASVQLSTTVVTRKRRCRYCYATSSLESQEQSQPEQGVPDMLTPDDSVLPDLRALPSFAIRVRNRDSGRSFIEFAATVWVGGDSPVVVEGFRRSDEPVMDAYQYFYEDGEVVGRAPAGTFEYDTRDRHQHWHILQFVQYQLLDADQTEVVRSRKESFCLVPTDAVDLSLDNAARAERGGDLFTSCGGEEALWIRETLPVGWGDTYYQGGRYGFDITDLPNGTYFVEVAANPEGLLYEQDATNNQALREVMLRGKPGDRKIIVPDPYGIDRW